MLTKFEPAESRILNLFLRQVDEIRKLGMINKQLEPVSVTLNFSQKDGVTSRIKGLDMDQFRSVLAGIRQFLSPKDLNLNRICNMLEKARLEERLISWVRAARQNWKKTLEDCPSHYFVDQKPVTVKDSIDLYFNAVLFHSDAERSLEWEKLDEYERNLILYSIRAALPPLMWSISTLDTIVDTVLNHPEREIPNFPRKET